MGEISHPSKLLWYQSIPDKDNKIGIVDNQLRVNVDSNSIATIPIPLLIINDDVWKIVLEINESLTVQGKPHTIIITSPLWNHWLIALWTIIWKYLVSSLTLSWTFLLKILDYRLRKSPLSLSWFSQHPFLKKKYLQNPYNIFLIALSNHQE